MTTWRDVVLEHFPDADDAFIEYIIWEKTGFPAFWNIPADGNTPEECFRKQVAEAAKEGTMKTDKEIMRLRAENIRLHGHDCASAINEVRAERDALRARVAVLEQAVEWCEDLLMGTIPEYPDYDNVQALAELRRKAKEG